VNCISDALASRKHPPGALTRSDLPVPHSPETPGEVIQNRSVGRPTRTIFGPQRELALPLRRAPGDASAALRYGRVDAGSRRAAGIPRNRRKNTALEQGLP